MGRFVIWIAVALGALPAAMPAPAGATPVPVRGWYMYGTTLSGLESAAYDHGCSFAENHPGGTRLMMLDFGAARQIDAATWGTLDFSGTRFANGAILEALKAAADGHHNCYAGVGGTTIAYGNSNYDMTGSGMSTTDAWYAGYYQSYRAQQLASYQEASGFNKQAAAAASDMEPAWDGPLITKQLVNGDTGHGWALYYDYGSAEGCPTSGSSGSCSNGWDVDDVAYVSNKGAAVPLPEIYFTSSADQWTVVRRWWNANSTGGYTFWGTTATTGVGLTGQEGWNALNARNPGLVLSELSCFC